VAELFPKARRILDFFHVAEHLWAVAHARFGEGTTAAQHWMKAKLEQLKQGGWARVCRALKQLRLTGAAAQIRDQTVGYLARHATPLAYDEYQAAGFPIGSGAIEGTCKHLVTSRCKQAGMRWSLEGLDALLLAALPGPQRTTGDLAPAAKTQTGLGERRRFSTLTSYTHQSRQILEIAPELIKFLAGAGDDDAFLNANPAELGHGFAAL
jgi:hypothetical protein